MAASKSAQYDDIIDAASKEWNVDPNLLRAVAHHESGWNPNAFNVNPNGTNDQGLMQINSDTAPSLGVTDRKDPVQSIYGAAKHISTSLDKFPGRPDLAIAAFNAGDKRVQDFVAGHGSLPVSTATKYIPSVAAHYAAYAGAAPQQPLTPSPSPMPARAASTVPTDDDFLKSIIPSDAKPASSVADEDFLKGVGAPPAAKSEPSISNTLSNDPITALTGEGTDEYGNVVRPLVQPPAGPTPILDAAKAYDAGVAKIGGAALQGAKQGFGDAPLGLSDQTANALRNAGVFPNPQTGQGGPLRFANEAVIRPLAAGADLALRAGGGLLRGAQAGVTALGDVLPAGPVFTANSGTPFGQFVDKGLTALASPQQAARMVASLPEAFPTGFGNASVPEAPVNPLATRPQFVSERFAPAATPGQSPLDRITQLIQHDNAETAPLAVPGLSPPAVTSPYAIPGTVSVGPGLGPRGSVGAAGAPAELSNMTPREAAASRATGEMQRVLAPAPEGMDTRIYVPGTKPTEAEVSGNPSVAFDQKLNRQQNPEPHVALERANNDARVEYYEQVAGTPTQVERLRETRGEQARKDLDAAFGSKQPTDAQPVVDTIKGILADPRLGERDLVQKYLGPLVDKLKKADGSLKDDPENLYGIREHVSDMLSKAGKATDPAVGQVERQLLAVKGALDEAIEAGAPGYRQYLQNYSEASRPIDAMEYLQDARPKLTNAQGNMTPASFDRFMKNTASERAAGGIKPAGSLTEDQMDVLHNIHSDLKRYQNISLSNPRGSDTSMLTEGAKKLAELSLHGMANVVSPVMGSIGLQMGKNALQKRAVNKMTERVLNPNPLHYPPPSAP